jgi:hypothetical protein
MTDLVERIRSFSKHLRDDIGTMLKEHQTEKIDFQEMTALVIGHEKTKHTSRNLLGTIYNTYQLNLFPYFIHLETKGRSDTFTLQLTLSTQEKELFSFKSYDEVNRNKKMVPVPEPLLEHLKQKQEAKILH